MELIRIAKTNLDITTEAELLSYAYTLIRPIEVVVRVDLGDDSAPIAGGATYTVRAYINDVIVNPDVGIDLSSITKTVLASRAIPLINNDVIKITAVGAPTDTAINVVTSLRDITPTTLDEVVGPGLVPVDQDYGGTDNLSFKTPLGAGISDATILIYRKVDYEAGDRLEEFIAGRTTTVSGGKWSHPVYLYPDDYVVISMKFSEFGPDRKDITVVSE